MQNSKVLKILIALILLFGIALTGFECSSTELTSAKLYIQQKQYDKAIESLKKDVEKNPKSDEGYYLLGYVYGEQQDFANMVDAYNNSLAASNKFAEDIKKSENYYWANQFNKGVRLYQDGTKTTDKDSSKILLDKSVDAFKNAILLEPDSTNSYKNLSFVYISKGDYDAAVEPLQKIIDIDKSADGYKYLGEILYDKGTQIKATDSVQAQDYFNKTINILEEGRKLYPKDSDILRTLANSYISANKIDVAKDIFRQGIEAEPENQYYKYNYGVLLLQAGDFQGAEEQFEKAIKIQPDYDNAIYNLAVTYVKWGAEINKEAEDKGEMENQAYKEKYKAALPYLEKVVEKRNDDPQMFELLGRVYTVLNMQDKAKDAFNKADALRGK